MARFMAVAVAAVILFASTSAHAITWQWNYIQGALADGGIVLPKNSGVLDEAQFLAESITIYPTVTGAGTTPAAGDTFSGYTIFRLTGFTIAGNAVPPPGSLDGTGTYGLDHEITGAIFYSGKHTDAQNFVFTSGELRVFFDAGTAGTGAGMTASSFATLSTFLDGVMVETGTALGIGGVVAAGVADGASNFVFLMSDVLSTLNTCGTPDPLNPGSQPGECGVFEITPFSPIFALTDNNNNICTDAGGTTTCNSTFAAILAAGNAEFGAGLVAAGAGGLNEHLQNDGSLEKATEAVPLPASLLLIGAGLSATALWARRSRRA